MNHLESQKAWTVRFLLLIAGLGGLLYGIDMGIIAGALPYLEATFRLTANQLSAVVAAVLLGSVVSTLFAGVLADLLGRKKLMALSGVLFVVSIPMIAMANEYGWLVAGRLLQGVSAGLIGVVVPLYLAECLSAVEPRQGYRRLSVAADRWNRRRRVDCHLFQHVAGTRQGVGQHRGAFGRQGSRLAQHFLGIAAAGNRVRTGQPTSSGVATLVVSPRSERRRPGCSAAHSHGAAGRSRTCGDGRSGHRRKGSDRFDGPTVGLATQIRSAVPAGLYHLGLQPVDGRELDHRLQCHYPHPGRPQRRSGPLGLRHPHRGELPDDDGRRALGRSQGPQIPPLAGQRRNHRLAAGRRG